MNLQLLNNAYQTWGANCNLQIPMGGGASVTVILVLDSLGVQIVIYKSLWVGVQVLPSYWS